MNSDMQEAKEATTVWITRYALTDGITRVEAQIDGNMVVYKPEGSFPMYAHGKDWHRTPEAALARAEQMCIAKIAALRKRIVKLEALTFSATTE